MTGQVDSLLVNLAALKAARYGGVRKVRFHSAGEERETEFKSDAEMASAILAIERDIALLSDTQTRTLIVRSFKGW